MPASLLIQSTKVVERQKGGFTVEMILSNAADLETAADVIQLRATLDTDDRYPRLPALQAIALRHVRAALTTEIQRLESLEGHRPSPSQPAS
jgi:hypothetical protein